ncbi:MAG: LLM class flavin-dependent oxidoreductase [Chloroflexota bacterium]|nr:LLM class flavin-dependent oxidoreductase [Chloroflexota bacterium]
MKIGLMMPIGERETEQGPLPYSVLEEMALRAEADGLDSVWVADHLLFRRDGVTRGIHEAWTMLTAFAAVTTRVAVGTLVLALPFRSPGVTAKMAAALDEVSGGRLILGIGCGWHEPEFDAFDFPFDHRVGRFEEAAEILVRLLREGHADFHGLYHVARSIELRPPAAPGRPPILIAGKQPRMLRLVARHAEAWNAAWYGTLDEADELRERLGGLAAALAAEGRDPATLEITVGLNVAFPDFAGDEELPAHVISGSVEQVADGLRGYEAVNASHLIVSLTPSTTEAVALLARAALLARVPVAAG